MPECRARIDNKSFRRTFATALGHLYTSSKNLIKQRILHQGRYDWRYFQLNVPLLAKK